MGTNIFLGVNAENITKDLAEEFVGVGLIRSEYLCRNINEYVTTEKCKAYIKNYLADICNLFDEKEVWYRFTDLTGNEIATLNGADDIFIEKWHFIGTKGVRRHLSHIETFTQECLIIKEVYEKYKNLGVIIPYIKDIKEYKKIKTIIRSVGYEGKIGIMAEIPSALLQLDSFVKEGVDNITIGLNDLTSLLLGTYRESNYHDKKHPTIQKAVMYTQNICEANKIPFSIAGYLNKEDINFYKELGVERITVNYSNLPQLNEKFNDLPQLDLLSKIKENTKRRRNLMEKEKEVK